MQNQCDRDRQLLAMFRGAFSEKASLNSCENSRGREALNHPPLSLTLSLSHSRQHLPILVKIRTVREILSRKRNENFLGALAAFLEYSYVSASSMPVE